MWQFVPRHLRRRIVSRLVRLPNRHPSADRPKIARSPYTIVGFASSHTSLGWTTRALERQLRSGGHTPYIVDVSERFGTSHRKLEAPLLELPPDPGTLILNVNPNQIAFALAGLPHSVLDNKYIVGSFVWELASVPQTWHRPIELVDEVWVPSRFVGDAIARAAPGKPVRLMPYQIAVPQTAKSMRAAFGLPLDRFLILVAANMRSGLARKNVTGAIEAFQRAFPYGSQRAMLVVKLHDVNLAPNASATLTPFTNHPDIQLIREDLDDEDMWRLVASCDSVLSMHRAEGYGLLLKQALLLGKPVVATGWSGNTDFMHDDPNAYLIDYHLTPVRDPEGVYDESDQLVWAEPNVAHAASVLVHLYEEWVHRQNFS